ncbi:hypothetical protein FE257_005828 [Aspergillus nanangensis]|uniref:LysM domain-containing protein n=1 Tax=Aspergillus nanangensis TaxID=2582783 RepID=A0AAD4CQ99_ASPNN|nr:hypothetical protein FE257_005828 [Aspergillus nanangensis]
MGYKAALLLGFLPQLLYADVVCTFSAPASSGDTCASFASAWGQTVNEFRALNPGATCPNLTAGQEYCVIGTVTDATTTTSTTTTTSKPPPTTTTSSGSAPGPTQPGIPANCDKFHQVVSGDQCDTIAAKYGITEAQFKALNPNVDASCSNLWLDYYVCVHTPGTTTTDPAPEPTGPTPQMPGIVTNCKTFYQVKSGDSCYTINTAAGITLAQFRTWNTLIDAGCSNLWVGYYVCTGI